MNISNLDWKKDYKVFIDYLKSLADADYQKLNERTGITEKSLGVRIPTLKKTAKDIYKGNYKDFIKYNKHNYYEEIILHGQIIGYIKDILENNNL